MNRAVIVARMRPGTEADIRRIFAQSDRTSLPHELGVVRRSLYAFGEVYLHLIDLVDDPGRSLSTATNLPAFRKIGTDLKPFIRPYYPATWRSPNDAMAREFYHWSADKGEPLGEAR